MGEAESDFLTVPILAIRGIVLFPGMTLHFDVGRPSSISAIKRAISKNEKIFIVTQRDIKVENPDFDDLYSMGTLSEILQTVRASDDGGSVRVIVEGQKRAALEEIVSKKPYLTGKVMTLEDEPIPEKLRDYETALVRNTHDLFMQYCDVSTKIPSDVQMEALNITEAGKLSDVIAGNIFFSIEDKQRELSYLKPLKRLEYLCVLLNREIDLLMLEDEISERVQDQMDKNQREYFLREQLKAIYDELGEGEDTPEESAKYIRLIKESKMDDDAKEKMYQEAKRLAKIAAGSPDSSVIRAYLDKVLALPWGKYTKDNFKIQSVRKQLDRDHYGLKEVKERVIEVLAARRLSPDIKGQIICLAGPPGVGKTSIAQSIAKAMRRKYVRVSLGGVHDEAEIRGHRRTYIGAIPGRIINAMIDAKSSNPVMLLDEVDKLGGDFRGDASSALLEVLDGEQNKTYCDHYIEIPFDLSKVLFITTANDKYAIPEPLLDRMDVIDLSSYTHEEKFNIAKKHLIPKQLKEHNIDRKSLKFSDKAIRIMIDGYTREAGVRQLERLIAKIARKSAVMFLESETESVSVTDENISDFLGPVKYKNDISSFCDEVGLVNGLAWTSVGGETLKVEASVLDGSGKLELTGSLGDVMKESAKTAVSLVRSRAAQYGIDADFYKTKDIHIHVPEGATPKDGPSAGVTIATALFSALSKIPAKSNVAMTGEITLLGKVLPIGGLKEKTMAAYRNGMKTVIIPYENLPDLHEIDDVVKNALTFKAVKTIDEVLSIALKKPDRCEKKISIPVKKDGSALPIYN